ncbi:unnamed protein product [Heligmosomoides polygyrus]|uniref:Ovule protein n=1 Tax=Heligmosomoides polygyrus TaxID=6339 RepID=A0A183G4I6_HELPZ|nr:unnamed protein product [Heligmosomoides polygyrus]
MHLCERQANLTRRACCQIVLLLNDTAKVRTVLIFGRHRDIQLTLVLLSYHQSKWKSPPVRLQQTWRSKMRWPCSTTSLLQLIHSCPEILTFAKVRVSVLH